MLEAWQEVRVFISSTFKDMQAERDHLVRFVFPRLREELLKRRFAALVEANGTRAVGFGCRQLPGLYQKYGRDRARAFIEAASAVGEAYGATAGQWFYEARTAAAREVLSGGRS